MRDYAVLPIISAGAFKRVLLCSPATRRLYAERNVYRAVQIDCPFAAIIRPRRMMNYDNVSTSRAAKNIYRLYVSSHVA